MKFGTDIRQPLGIENETGPQRGLVRGSRNLRKSIMAECAIAGRIFFTKKVMLCIFGKEILCRLNFTQEYGSENDFKKKLRVTSCVVIIPEIMMWRQFQDIFLT